MEVHVPVRKMKTGNNSRDSRMYRMFHADSHPYITGMMDARHMIDSGVAETVPVSLTICGSSRDVMADISSGKSPTFYLHIASSIHLLI